MDIRTALYGSELFVTVSENAKVRDLKEAAGRSWGLEEHSFSLRGECSDEYNEDDTLISALSFGSCESIHIEPDQKHAARRQLREMWGITGDYEQALIHLLDRHGTVNVQQHCTPYQPYDITDTPSPKDYCTGESEPALQCLWGCIETVDATDTWGSTILMRACDGGHARTAAQLLDKGAGINQVNHALQTPLMFAAMRGHMDLAVFLLRRGADINKRDANGWTAWMHAVHVTASGAAYLRRISRRGLLRQIWETVELWSNDTQMIAALVIGVPAFSGVYIQSAAALPLGIQCEDGSALCELLSYAGAVSFIGARVLITAMLMTCYGGFLSRVLKFLRDTS
eukprot:TRINITY_DN50443_c0_g1_i1.p1 TRINITY_DN50443_c0_g1~~TRINITY_DN50443_c0_g1_i1.p1  ORF type:complete len:341 (+),score=110.27 TRINITY_DN50443_c0_g1_i1:48-1070(+)